jgi:transcriptional regulator with XRE-family HTH domain
MRAALAERDIAEVFARLQRAGVSQRRIAALTGQSQSQSEISEILSGRRVCAYDVFVRIADGLGVPRGWMGLAYDRLAGDAVGRLRVDEEATDVRRRAFLAAAAAGAAVVASQVDGFVGPVGPLPLRDVVASMSRAMLPTGGSVEWEPMSAVALTENVRQAWVLRQQTKYEALGKVLPVLIEESDRAVKASADDPQHGLRLCVHAYNLASARLKRVGEPHLALVASDRALTAAKQLDDNLLIGTAAHRQANVLLTAGRPGEARRVALAAAGSLEIELRRSPRGLAMWGALLLTAALGGGPGVRRGRRVGDPRRGEVGGQHARRRPRGHLRGIRPDQRRDPRRADRC